jgi:hypothetical protein
MTVTVTDLRTEIDQADAVTGWTGSVSPSVFTTEPEPIELSAHLGQIISKTSGYLFHTHGANIDGTSPGVLVYVWVLSKGSPLSKASGGIGIVIGDGTDLVGYHLAGGDEAGFRHNTGNPYYQCLLIDTSQLSGFTNKKVWLGTDSLDMTALTDFGSEWDVGTAKAVGGVANCFTDAIRVGNEGLGVTGGADGTEGTFAEIVAEDASTADTKAYGVIRELSSGVYGVQGPLTFGDSTGTENCYFEDANVVVVFEDREIADDKYFIKLYGDSGYTNSFSLSDTTIKSAGPQVVCNFAGGNVDTLALDAVNFASLGKPITFSNGADATGHSVLNCVFTACGQIDPGQADFTSNTISSTTDSTSGALLMDSDATGTSNLSDLTFNSGGSGHAIYIPTGATGTYVLANFSYNGYGATDSTDAVVHNDSGGSVILQISGGDTPTYYNDATGSDTTVQQTVTFGISNIESGSEVRIYDEDTAGRPELDGTETSGTTFNYLYNSADAPINVSVVVFHLDYKPLFLYRTLPAADSALTVFQIPDRNYDNP